MPEKQIEGTHYNLKDMARRLAAYNKANCSDDAEPAIADFFEGHQVEIFKQNIEKQRCSKKVLNACKIYIERNERPFNYMTYDDEEEKERIQNEEQHRNALNQD